MTTNSVTSSTMGANAALWRTLVDAARKGTGTDEDDAANWEQFMAGLPGEMRNLVEAAQNWNELAEKVRYCLEDSPNNYADMYGGSDNFIAHVISQGRGYSSVQVTLTYFCRTDIREDLTAVVRDARNQGTE